MTATLRIIGNGPAIVYKLEKLSTTIGRHGDFKTPINHSSVSRLHCAIFDSGTLGIGAAVHTIRDLNSYTGTVVNGKSIGNKEKILSDGDKVSLGNHVVVLYRKGD